MKQLWALPLVVLLLGGCFTLKIDVAGRNGIAAMTDVKGSVEGSFTEAETVSFLFWGLTQHKNADPDAVLRPYMTRNRRIANLKITTEQTFMDGLLSAVTLGIYNPWTVRYEGDVIRR